MSLIDTFLVLQLTLRNNSEYNLNKIRSFDMKKINKLLLLTLFLFWGSIVKADTIRRDRIY